MRFKHLKVQEAWERNKDVIKTTDEQYLLLEIMTGVPAQTCREICNLQRAIRKTLPKGKESAKQEQEVKIELGYNTQSVAISEQEIKKEFDRQMGIETTTHQTGETEINWSSIFKGNQHPLA